MMLRVGALVVVAALQCSESASTPDASQPCAVDQAPGEAISTCGPPPPQCCGMPWCGPDLSDSSYFCSSHGGASWCCACADPEDTGTLQWVVWKMECGLGSRDASAD